MKGSGPLVSVGRPVLAVAVVTGPKLPPAGSTTIPAQNVGPYVTPFLPLLVPDKKLCQPVTAKTLEKRCVAAGSQTYGYGTVAAINLPFTAQLVARLRPVAAMLCCHPVCIAGPSADLCRFRGLINAVPVDRPCRRRLMDRLAGWRPLRPHDTGRLESSDPRVRAAFMTNTDAPRSVFVRVRDGGADAGSGRYRSTLPGLCVSVWGFCSCRHSGPQSAAPTQVPVGPVTHRCSPGPSLSNGHTHCRR